MQSIGLHILENRLKLLHSGQLHLQTENYEEAIGVYKRVLGMPAPEWETEASKRSPLYLIAVSCYYLRQYEEAIRYMERLFAIPGRYPEAWYSMLVTLYLKTNQPLLARPVLEEMIAYFDKEKYRKALAQINANKRIGWVPD
jgi:tetratricopeptide (TPR) repeat protein